MNTVEEPDTLNPLFLEIGEGLGSIGPIRSVGSSRSTYIIQTEKVTLVAKRMTYDRDPAVYFELLTCLAELPSPFCPRMLGTVCPDADCWYAVFEWVDGSDPGSWSSEKGLVWRSVLYLLRRIRSCAVVPEWPLESIWLDRLGNALSDDPIAGLILEALRSRIPRDSRRLAHGDFSVQNLLSEANELVLLDWEEVGSAPAGFDAGWMLALARMGYAPIISYNAMRGSFLNDGLPEMNLNWFEMLGLLRVLFRTRTLSMDSGIRQRILLSVRRVISECADEWKM